MNKYSLTKEGDYYRITALRDFGTIKKGTIGGKVEGPDNLSHEGNCWVYGNARVSGNAVVSGNAQVSGDAWVSGDNRVCSNDWAFNYAQEDMLIEMNGKKYKLVEVE